ncbi:Lipid phosphate phosphatase gamma [Rhodotorula toruloides]|nr:Lipid phosphate phosphatase gamma [Rhodotorula toruloides]
MIRQLWLYTLQNTQFVVTTLTAYFILRIRTAHSLYFGAGTLVAAFTAKILKRFIRQPRPVGAKKYEKTYGMPSTHSSSIAFFGTYLSLSSLLLPLHPRVTSLLPFWNRFSNLATTRGLGAAQKSFWRHMAGEWGQRVTRILLALCFLAGTASVCWSRVRLGHHTKAQVIAGASLGSTIALAWMTLWLGLDGWSTLSGKDLENVVAGFAGGAGKAVPTWLIHGVKEPAIVWERAAEDAAFVALEAWETRRWEGLKELRYLFPLIRRGAGGEL